MTYREWVTGFWRRVLRLGTTQCWTWTGTIGTDGYGQLKRIDGQTNVGAHRASVEISGRAIPRGKVVMHRCDNRRCVNPSHLLIGTQRDNIMDMHKKGRANLNIRRGEDHGSAKITNAQADEIRRKYDNRGEEYTTQTRLAREYGISQAQISRIINGKRRV